MIRQVMRYFSLSIIRKVFTRVLYTYFITCNSVAWAQKPIQAHKPNILWLIAEDISPYLAYFGDSTIKTPNLDRLAREGIIYKNVFDVSGVCAPSRSCLITGMYPTCIGTNNMRTLKTYPQAGIPDYSVVLPPEVKMFSELMRINGYYCTNNSKQDYQFVAPLSGWNESSGKAHWRNRPTGMPFFSVFTFNVTHESQIWEKKNDPLLVDPARVPVPPYYPDSPVIRQDLARMYSNIIEMDIQVGEKLKQLEDDRLLDNTIIIWFSDNGGPLPRGKREIYDTGLHIPMIIRFPDKRLAATVNEDLISFVDFAPTTLSLAGIKIPDYMQGVAFAGIEKGKPRKYIYAARDRMDSEYDMVRAVRDNRFKYIKNFQPEKPYMQNIAYRKQMGIMNELFRYEKEGKLNKVQSLWFRKSKAPEELYDTEADPYEFHNLASDPKHLRKLNELRSELADWMKRVDDKGFIPEKEWVERMWPGLIQPVTAQPEFHIQSGVFLIKSETRGASISYQVVKKGQTPDKKAWKVYQHPIKINENEKIIAVAERIGFKSSIITEITL